MSWFWFLVGILVGLIIWLRQRVSVMQFSPERISAARRSVVLGAVLCWILTTAVLIYALQGGLGNGLSAFAGLMSARWIGIFSLRLFPVRDKNGLKRI